MRKRWRVLIGVLLLLLLAVGILWVYVRKRLDDESKAAAAILVAWNDKVAFYGKVVDQHDQPVQGVKVSIRLSGWNRGFLRGGRGLQNRMEFIRHTDAKGRFGIENQDGTSLGIGRDSFHKEGYINPIHLPKGGGSFFYGGYYLEDEKHHPDPDQPVVYRMWKRSADPPRRLIKRKSGYHCKMNGKWHGRDLITWERLSLKDPRADLILSARIEEQGEDPDVYDWELTLEMLEGGIQATDDAHLFLAPKDGYEKKIVIKRRFPDCFRNNYYYQGGFYLRSYEGRVHASVYIWADNPKGLERSWRRDNP